LAALLAGYCNLSAQLDREQQEDRSMIAETFFSLQQFMTEYILGKKDTSFNVTVNEYIIGI
jgi:hypothetical protein